MHGYSPIFRGARVLFFIRPRAGVGARRVLSSPSVSSSRTTPSPPRGAAKSRARDSRARDARRRVGRVEPPGDGAAAPDDAGRGEGEAAGRAAGRGQGAMGARPVPRRVDLLGPRRASPPPTPLPPDRSDAPGFSPASSRRWLHRRVAGGTRATRERPDASRTSNASRRSSTNRVVTRRPRPSPVLLGIKRMTRLRGRRSSDARLDIPAPPVRSPRSFVSDLPRAPSHIHRSSPARSRSPPTSVTRPRRRRRRRWWRATSPASTSSPPPTRSRANSSAPR